MRDASRQYRIATLIALILLALGSKAMHAAIPASERTVRLNVDTSTNGGTRTTCTNRNGAAGTECAWFGVTGNGAQSTETGIDLHSNDLTGSLLSDLSNVTNLTLLMAYSNQLTGSIPFLTGLIRASYLPLTIQMRVPQQMAVLDTVRPGSRSRWARPRA